MDKFLGFDDVDKLDFHNPVDVICTIIWLLMLILSIPLVPAGILVGPPGWGLLVLWYIVFEQVKPHPNPSRASSAPRPEDHHRFAEQPTQRLPLRPE